MIDDHEGHAPDERVEDQQQVGFERAAHGSESNKSERRAWDRHSSRFTCSTVQSALHLAASMSFSAIIRKPSAWLLPAMSLAVLAMLLVAFLRGSLVPEPDEGAVAHLFQILMAAQLPIIAFFAIKWLPRAPRPALAVLGLQAAAALAACAPVFFLGL